MVAGKESPEAWRFGRSVKSTVLPVFMMTLLFVLVAGLTQLPAAVIYTPVTFSRTVGTGEIASTTLLTLDLPGTSTLNIAELSFGSSPRSNFYQIYTPVGFTVPAVVYGSLYYWHSLNVSETWDNLPSGQTFTSWGANISRLNQSGDESFLLRSDPTFLPFRFIDSTDLSTKYGYIALATSVTGSGPSAQFHLNITGYAFDNSGAEIAMGAVPEPSTALLAVIGSLAVVAGSRCKRRKSIWC